MAATSTPSACWVQRSALLRTGVDAEPPPARLLGVDRHLDLDSALLGQHQRRLQGEFLQHRAADLVAGPQRQLHERRAGHDDRAVHGVVGQPGLARPGTAGR